MHPHLRQIWLPLTPTIKAYRALNVSIRLKASPWQCEEEGRVWKRRVDSADVTERNARGREEWVWGTRGSRSQREGGGFRTRDRPELRGPTGRANNVTPTVWAVRGNPYLQHRTAPYLHKVAGGGLDRATCNGAAWPFAPASVLLCWWLSGSLAGRQVASTPLLTLTVSVSQITGHLNGAQSCRGT